MDHASTPQALIAGADPTILEYADSERSTISPLTEQHARLSDTPPHYIKSEVSSPKDTPPHYMKSEVSSPKDTPPHYMKSEVSSPKDKPPHYMKSEVSSPKDTPPHYIKSEVSSPKDTPPHYMKSEVSSPKDTPPHYMKSEVSSPKDTPPHYMKSEVSSPKDKPPHYMKSEVSSPKDKPSFKSESMNVPKLPLQRVSPDSNITRKPNHKQQVSQMGIDNSEHLEIKAYKIRPNRSLVNKPSHSEPFPEYSNSFSTSSSLAASRHLNLVRTGSPVRCPPDRRRGRLKEFSSHNASSNRLNDLASPPTKYLDSFLVTSCRSISLSPVSSHRKAFPAQNPAHSRHPDSKAILAGCDSELRTGQTGNRVDTSHIKYPATHRDMASPIYSGLRGDEGRRGRHTPGPQRNHDVSDDVVAVSTEGSLFPAIKIEKCDESSDEFPTRFPGSKGYFCEIKRSATIPNDTFSEIVNADLAGVRHNLTSLNVPSPYVEWRTSEGRIIAAVNDSRFSESLSRVWSHSEGNIPFALRDSREQIREDPLSHNTDQTPNINLLPRQFSRITNHQPSVNPLLFARSAPIESTNVNERHLLTPTLPTELLTRSAARQSRLAHVTDMKRNVKFLSPQPQRKLGPKF